MNNALSKIVIRFYNNNYKRNHTHLIYFAISALTHRSFQ